MPIQVLIADDHSVLRHCLASALEAEPGLAIAGQAEDGREAVLLTQRLKPDVVVMDISMPNLNGIDATRQIVDSGEAAHVVALTMHREIGIVQQMLQAGADGYALKSSPIEELIRAIRNAADGKCYLSPEIAHLVLNDYRRAGGNGQTNGNGHGRRNGNGRSTQAVVDTAGDLSAREREVLQLISEGHSSKTIAAELCLSVKTIETHRQRLMGKLGIHSIAELTKFAIREGLTTLELSAR